METSTPHIRRATAHDRESIWPLARDFATSFRPDKSIFDTTFDSMLAAPGILLLAAVAEDGSVVGYLLGHAQLTFLANGPVVWIEEIMVVDSARRSGVGSLLMAAAEAWAVETGAAYVSLASRRARDFYLALGYDDSATFFKKTLGPAR